MTSYKCFGVVLKRAKDRISFVVELKRMLLIDLDFLFKHLYLVRSTLCQLQGALAFIKRSKNTITFLTPYPISAPYFLFRTLYLHHIYFLIPYLYYTVTGKFTCETSAASLSSINIATSSVSH